MRDFAITLSIPLIFLIGCGSAMLLLPPPSAQPLVFSETELPATVSGQPYAVTVLISGNISPVQTVSITSGALPKGLELIKVTAAGNISGFTIAGTPTSHGGYTFTIRAWTSGDGHNLPQQGEATYTLRVT